MIVVDASALAKMVLQEENWTEVEKQLTNNPYSLEYVLTEVTNAIWKECALRRRITPSEASVKFDALQLLTAHTLVLEGSSIYMKDGLKVAIREGVPIYDMLYILQAKKHGPLLTCDHDQKTLAEKMGVKTIYIK